MTHRSIGLRACFKRFCRNQRGNVLVTTALFALPLVLSVGVAVDTAETYRAQTNFQNAVDAAALVAAKSISRGGTEAQAQEVAERIFYANLISTLGHRDATIEIRNSSGDCSSDGVVATANLRHPVFFDRIHTAFADDPGHANLGAESVVKCGNSSVEIALVLDNSGSMAFRNRLSTAETAAKDLVLAVHGTMTNRKQGEVKFSLVPFSSTVNVGAGNRNAAWLDTRGRSPTHHENLSWSDWPEFAYSDGNGGWKRRSNGQSLTRMTLYDELGINWDGCVEQRPHPHTTRATASSSFNPATLYVPSFAPDEPNNYSDRNLKEETFTNDYVSDAHNFGEQDGMNGSNYASYTGTARNFGTKQHARQAWPWKYVRAPNGARSRTVRPDPNHLGAEGGPNFTCLSQPVTRLTANQTQMTNAIDRMKAEGGTTIPQGIVWGWNTLTHSEPFADGKRSSDVTNRKIIVLMTDGANTYYPTTSNAFSTVNRSFYGAYGLSANGRIFEGTGFSSGVRHNSANFTAAMNEHTTQTCANARADGIIIYTVGFSLDDDTETKSTLEACTSSKNGRKLFFDAADNDELLKAFSAIAESIADLRVSK